MPDTGLEYNIQITQECTEYGIEPRTASRVDDSNNGGIQVDTGKTDAPEGYGIERGTKLGDPGLTQR